ncbi:hypothetical protein PGH45_19330 [Legionella pneumophila]|nr:hypothetical protein [Legionella pneumophila]
MWWIDLETRRGMVEWIVSVPKNEAYGLRLAHRAGYGSNGSSCQYNEELVYKQYGGIINDGELSLVSRRWRANVITHLA